MGTQLYTGTLVVLDCYKCHIMFGIPREMNDRALRDGSSFFCPNGHSQCYTEPEEKRLRKQLEDERNRVTRLRARIDQEQAAAEHERRRAAAARGQLTKLRNRVARGVCPDTKCKRSFSNIADHVRTCHPELVDALDG